MRRPLWPESFYYDRSWFRTALDLDFLRKDLTGTEGPGRVPFVEVGTMEKSYLFTMNGAGIKHHDGPRAFEQAMAQARQWKANNPEKNVTVEGYVWNPARHEGRGGYQRTFEDVQIEIPTLVPELTRKHDFDYLPELP